MRKQKSTAALLIITALIFSMLFSVISFADKHHEGDEEGTICVINHLDESSWEMNGQFMNYNREGYYSMIGVDVSKWNGDIDWFALRKQGVEFAIIRVGCRGYESGEIIPDERFYEYMDGATAAGMAIGIYFYSQAIDEEEAVQEAEYVIDQIAGYRVELPIFFDTEDVVGGDARTNIMAVGNYTINALAFCQAIESHGYRAGVYASKDWFINNLDLPSLSNYEIWYANYGSTPGTEVAFDIWQYTSEGVLDGCETQIDLNVRVLKMS